MPKKKKIVQVKENESADAAPKTRAEKGNRPRRAVVNRKPRETSAKKTVVKAEAPVPVNAPRPADASDETIRLRAYFISERRRRFALPGDAESDWLEAKRQLLTEADNG